MLNSRLVLALVLVVLAFATAGLAKKKNPPNVIFIMTDDQDSLLGSVNYMPLLKENIIDKGLSVNRAYVTTSLCCPSRSTLLTGTYCSNHKVWGNAYSSNGGFHKYFEQGHEENSLPAWFKSKNYKTGLVGKYLNDYREDDTAHVPPFWDEWFAVTSDDEDPWDQTQYSNNGVNYDGTGEYQTDTLKERAHRFINNHKQDPFFLIVTPEAPHSPADPAPRHAALYPNLKNPKIRAWNESTEYQSQKPIWLGTLPYLTAAQEQAFDQRYRLRTLSLLAVDELVANITNTLEALNLLDNTYIFYTSDNGFHQGQHRLTNGKRQAYEEDILVPFFVRGPRIAPGAKIDNMVAFIDVAPTLLEIAGFKKNQMPEQLDGVSAFKMFTNARKGVPDPWRYDDQDDDDEISTHKDPSPIRHYTMLVANYTFGGSSTNKNDYYGIRLWEQRSGRDTLYVEWYTGDCEFYDLVTDPFQLDNACDTLSPAKKASLSSLLAQLKTCSGASCRNLRLVPRHDDDDKRRRD